MPPPISGHVQIDYYVGDQLQLQRTFNAPATADVIKAKKWAIDNLRPLCRGGDHSSMRITVRGPGLQVIETQEYVAQHSGNGCKWAHSTIAGFSDAHVD